MKIALIIVRTLFGLMYLFASISYFFKLMAPPPSTGDMKIFEQAMSFFLLPFVKVIELLCGIAFVTGRYVTLATIVIFPIMLGIVLVNVFLSPANAPMAFVLLAFNLFLAWYYRKNYALLFVAK